MITSHALSIMNSHNFLQDVASWCKYFGVYYEEKNNDMKRFSSLALLAQIQIWFHTSNWHWLKRVLESLVVLIKHWVNTIWESWKRRTLMLGKWCAKDLTFQCSFHYTQLIWFNIGGRLNTAVAGIDERYIENEQVRVDTWASHLGL